MRVMLTNKKQVQLNKVEVSETDLKVKLESLGNDTSSHEKCEHA